MDHADWILILHISDHCLSDGFVQGGGRAERDIVSYSLFISYFPYVCSGPISRANQILPQIKTLPKYSSECFDRGIKEILCGYFKKLVVADTIAVYVNNVFSNINEFTGFALLLAAFLFSIQIYCDFSGYTDMAIGYSRLLGIELSVNFKTPYFSSSITEFWRRWHISLSSWFRDYVYIPLGGNRKGRFRQYCNLLITFMVSGIWHGDSLTFIVWGGIHGALQIIEKQFMGSVAVKKENKIQKLINTIIVFILVTCAWVFFKANTISDAFYVFQNMFDGISNLSSYITIGFHEIGITRKVLLVIIMNLFILFIVDLSELKGTKENAQNSILSYSFYSLLLVVIILFSPKGVASQFVYFQF